MEPTTTVASSNSDAATTPLARQVQALKDQHRDTILFFRLGDFYETFNEDAQLVARELQLTLTSRSLAPGQCCPMTGVPAHSIDQHIALLIARGHKVAIAEQLTEANGPSQSSDMEDPTVTAGDPAAPPTVAEDAAPAPEALVDASSVGAGELGDEVDAAEDDQIDEPEPHPGASAHSRQAEAPPDVAPPSGGEKEIAEPQAEQDPTTRELKIVIRLKPSPGGYRAALSISTPQTDVVSAIEHVDGIAGALAAVPRFIEQAEQVWAGSPRYPQLAPTKAAADPQPPVPQPPAESAPAAPAPQLSLF